MQFHPTGFDPTPRATLVCRYQRFGYLVLLVLLWGLPAACWFVETPWPLRYGLAALAIFVTPTVVRSWRYRGRRDNWAMAVDNHALWLNLRDCEYHAAAPGETIVSIPFQELHSARRQIDRYTVPDSEKGEIKYSDAYLVLYLVKPEASLIQERIDAEQRRETPLHRSFWGLVVTRVPRSIATIQTVGVDQVRILHSSSTHRLTPRLKHILQELQRFVPIESDEQTLSKQWEELSDSDFDDRILTLVAQGRRIEAMRLAQSKKGLSVTEAHQLVDSLRS